ncbi:MAG: metallophosphoesterase [Candidatus Hadarchaeales archaeon]
MLVPVEGAPAMLLRLRRERVLVVADLHLGVESSLVEEGLSLPSQTPKVRDRLMDLISAHSPDRLVMLGDVKHNVPISSWQEWRELPSLFDELSKLVEVDVVKGNHDGGLEGMLPKGVRIQGPRGITIGERSRIGLMHGHTWPSAELMRAKVILAGHNHPAVEFRDELGGRVVVPVWLRCPINADGLPPSLKKSVKGKAPKLVVLPAFGELIGGTPVNREMPEELIGPVFKSRAARIEEAEAYTLDGTFLGKVKNISPNMPMKAR